MPKADTPFFGSADQQAMQQRADAGVAAAIEAPGVVLHARAFSVDDVAAVGWDTIRARLQTDGFVTLRGATLDEIAQAKHQLATLSPTAHSWNFHFGEAKAVRDACAPFVAGTLPTGTELFRPSQPTEHHAAQEFMDALGISPFSKTALSGDLFPATLLVIRDTATKAILASGFASMTHNRFSPWARTAWVGLIAVDANHQGQGLGKTINAACALAALNELGAASIMEFVGPTNHASAAMVSACGVPNDPNRQVVVFSQSGNRITR